MTAAGEADGGAIPWRAALFWILIAVLCLPVTGFLILGFGALAIGYRQFSIPAGSMAPTIEIGDRVMARPLSTPSAIRRGDIVFYRSPEEGGTIFVKRAIGLPGDRVRLENGVVIVNDVAFDRTENGLDEKPRASVGYQECDDALSTDALCVKRRYRERVPPALGRSLGYAVVDSDSLYLDTTREIVVPDGALFVMGDNRDNSRDSRMPGPDQFAPIDTVLYRNGFIWFSTKGGVARWMSSIAPDEVDSK